MYLEKFQSRHPLSSMPCLSLSNSKLAQNKPILNLIPIIRKDLEAYLVAAPSRRFVVTPYQSSLEKALSFWLASDPHTFSLGVIGVVSLQTFSLTLINLKTATTAFDFQSAFEIEGI